MKNKAVIWSARTGLPSLFGGAPEQGLTTLLFHNFIFNGEALEAARERLKRQLDFLVTRFVPVALDAQVNRYASHEDGKPRVLVTVDDAKCDILDVIDLFDTFGVPVAQFVCAGWTDRASNTESADGLKARITSWLHFYDGNQDTVSLAGTEYRLDTAGNSALIDMVIGADPEVLGYLAACERAARDAGTGRTICTWAELKDLQGAGMLMGCHSVSHPRIGQQSSQRQHYEIEGSKALIEAHLGPCPWFAYPYGTPEAHGAKSYEILQSSKIKAGFTTRPALIDATTDPLVLPRIAMPNDAMDQVHFQARATGGNVPFARIKEWIS